MTILNHSLQNKVGVLVSIKCYLYYITITLIFIQNSAVNIIITISSDLKYMGGKSSTVSGVKHFHNGKYWS